MYNVYYTYKQNGTKQTVVTLTFEVHVNSDVNLFTEVQIANRKSEKSRHSIRIEWLVYTTLYLSLQFDEC